MKLYFEKGRTVYTLARKFEVATDTIYIWERIYKPDGGLDGQRRGRSGYHNQEDYKERYEFLKKFTVYLKDDDDKKR
jgi:transposase